MLRGEWNLGAVAVLVAFLLLVLIGCANVPSPESRAAWLASRLKAVEEALAEAKGQTSPIDASLHREVAALGDWLRAIEDESVQSYAMRRDWAELSWRLVAVQEALVRIAEPPSFASDVEPYAAFRTFRLLKRHGDKICSMAFSPDGLLFASSSETGTVRLWELQQGKEVRDLRGHGGSACSVSFSPDGRVLASGSQDKTVRLWDISSGRQIRVFNAADRDFGSIAFSPDGRLLAAGSTGGTVHLWEVTTGREVSNLIVPPGYDRVAVAFQPAGRLLALGNRDGETRLWDVAEGREVGVLKRGTHGPIAFPRVSSVAFSPDGQHLAAAINGGFSDDKGEIRVWKVATGREVGVFRGHQGYVSSVSYAPEGHLIASGGTYGDNLRIWDVTRGDQARAIKAHRYHVRIVSWSPDGHLLASAGSDENIRLWEYLPRFFTIAGEPIDWSEGRPQGPPFVEAEAVVTEGAPGVLPDHTSLRITVHNSGKGAVFRLQGVTRSDVPAFASRPLLFGKIERQKSKTRVLSFPIPKDLKTGAYTVRLVWKEVNGFVPQEVTARLDLKALPRPNLLASLRVVDDGSGQSVGNGDGIIQSGEAVDLILTIKNAGDREAEHTTVEVTLPEHPGLHLFGDRKMSLGNIAVGAVKEARFNVAVRRGSDL